MNDDTLVKNMSGMSIEKLRRKENQHWKMAACARQDGNKTNEAKHIQLARLYRSAAVER